MPGDDHDLSLPDQLAGPFLREYVPTGGLPQPRSQIASVVFYGKGAYSIVTARGTEHFGRRLMARPVTVCEIARGTHVTRLEVELPARGGATFFRVEVDAHWSVTDHLVVVEERVTDVAERLHGPVVERLRQICEQYRVDEVPEAERVVGARCQDGGWDDLGHGLGLRVRLFVRFTTDEKTLAQADGRRDLAWEDERRRHAHDGDLVAERHRVELLQMRMRAFQTMIERGQWSQLAYMLAERPEEARAYLELLRQEARADRRGLLDTTLGLIKDGVIQSPELEEQVTGLLKEGGFQIRGSLNRPPRRSLEPGPGPGKQPGPPDYTPTWVDGAGQGAWDGAPSQEWDAEPAGPDEEWPWETGDGAR
ncbi:hypothetical protein [Kitasatospora viridis]|uniref:SPFH domain/Band 7 family protein n=1 Tax=Kitasatospora viridis TaxID=281105 RepID=A0A561SFL6_9ACTN|nr:hypothetical protein [Kitasatospora viridis]TWF73608.1 hypothetical protein FHX73_15221 [Kitasatospora viridis]